MVRPARRRGPFDGVFAPDNILLSAHEAAVDTRIIRDIWEEDVHSQPEEVGQAGEVMTTWMPHYVLIGTDTYGGGLFVDARPGPLSGCVRYWDKTEADDDYGRGVVANSITDLVMRLTKAMQSSTAFAAPRASYLPTFDHGVLAWGDPIY